MPKENACRLIYREAFRDPDTFFEDRLFENCFKNCFSLEENGETVAMLFALPCKMLLEGGAVNAIYIYAAATSEKHRGKGYMSRLLERVKKENGGLIFLKPANEPLIAFYEKNGFTAIKTDNSGKKAPYILPLNGYAKLIKETKIPEDKNDFTVMYRKTENISLESLYFVNSME